MELVIEIVNVFVEMAPYLMFGFLFAGVLHVFVKKETVLKHLGEKSLWSVIKASLFGVPLPLCSCSVIPTAISLKKSGASNPSVMSFLISTPLTGVDSIVATYGVLGPVFAIFRPIAAFLIGIAGGVAALVVNTDKIDKKIVEGPSSCGCGPKPEKVVSAPEVEASCCGADSKKTVASEGSCCSGGGESEASKKQLSFIFRITNVVKQVWEYAFKTLLDDIVVPLMVGVVISGVISWVIPDNFFGDLNVPTFVQMIVMIIVGVPIYICATASLPIGAALLLKGLSPGVIFVFLAAGPVTNSATIALIIKQFGKKFFVLYFGVIAVLAVLCGLLLDFIIEAFNLSIVPSIMEHGEHESSVVMVAVGIAFFILVIASLKRRFIPAKIKESSCCS